MDACNKQSILQAGIAAPSADNSQPWRFVWHGDHLDLWIDVNRSGGPSDNRYVLSDLAAGACLQNMIIRAAALGHKADLQLFPDAGEALWVARMGWRSADSICDEDATLARAIETRCTDRRFPWSGAIASDVCARLDAQAQRLTGRPLYWPQKHGERKAALGTMRRAEALRFKSPTLHAELFSSIDFSVGWHKACKEGLPPAALAVEPPLRPFFRMLRQPAVMAALNRVGAAPVMGLRSAYLPARLAPGLCLLTVPSTSRADVLAGGRALQRVWLQASIEGLSVQPYAAAGVLGLGFVTVESELQSQMARLYDDMAHLCPDGHGLVFLRLGYTRSQPPHRSSRRSLVSFGAFE